MADYCRQQIITNGNIDCLSNVISVTNNKYTYRVQPIGWTCYGGNGEDIFLHDNEANVDIYVCCKVTNFETHEVSYI